MKLRLPTRNLLNPTNHNRIISSNTLHIRHHNSILFSRTYLLRRKLWLNYPLSPCQRSFHIIYLPIHTRRMRNLLRIIHLHRNMKHRYYLTIHSHSYHLHRICSPMRTNIILRSHSNYQPTFSNPVHWIQSSRMNLRWILCRQSHPNPILRIPLYPTLYYHSTSNSPPPIPTRNRIKQPIRNQF
uniref:Uncharacterized protein n=1 Tax=Castor canadensis TaxID=51338 RepID=A0A8C0WK66_CASCN